MDFDKIYEYIRPLMESLVPNDNIIKAARLEFTGERNLYSIRKVVDYITEEERTKFTLNDWVTLHADESRIGIVYNNPPVGISGLYVYILWERETIAHRVNVFTLKNITNK